MRAIRTEGQSRAQAHAIQDIAARMAALFERCPALVGFSVRDGDTLELDPGLAEGALCVADLELHDWPGAADRDGVHAAIVGALVSLVEERPEAFELLCGRTFARAFH